MTLSAILLRKHLLGNLHLTTDPVSDFEVLRGPGIGQGFRRDELLQQLRVAFEVLLGKSPPLVRADLLRRLAVLDDSGRLIKGMACLTLILVDNRQHVVTRRARRRKE